MVGSIPPGIFLYLCNGIVAHSIVFGACSKSRVVLHVYKSWVSLRAIAIGWQFPQARLILNVGKQALRPSELAASRLEKHRMDWDGLGYPRWMDSNRSAAGVSRSSQHHNATARTQFGGTEHKLYPSSYLCRSQLNWTKNSCFTLLHIFMDAASLKRWRQDQGTHFLKFRGEMGRGDLWQSWTTPLYKFSTIRLPLDDKHLVDPARSSQLTGNGKIQNVPRAWNGLKY